MKRSTALIKIFALLLAMAIVSPAVAQTRRKTTTRRATTTTRTSTAKKTTMPQTSGKYLLYNISEYMCYFNAHDYFLFVHSDACGNSVIGIDKTTGAVKTLIPARQKLYEGEERPFVDYVCVTGDYMLIFVYHDKRSDTYCGYFTVYSAPLNNPVYANWNKIGQLNAISRGYIKLSDNTKTITIFANNYYYYTGYYDSSSNSIKLKKLENQFLTGESFCVSNGGVVYRGGSFMKDNKEKRYHKYWEPIYKQMNPNASPDIKGIFIHSDGYVYVTTPRRIYRTLADNPGTFEEFARIPPTFKYSFMCSYYNSFLRGGVVLNSKGDVFDGYKILYKDKTEPEIVVNEYGKLKTDIIRPGLGFYSFGFSTLSDTPLLVDYHDNFAAINGHELLIYNPYGINGYAQAKGKYVEIK